MDASALRQASTLSLLDTGDWLRGDGAEPMGAATQESPRSARKRDQYKLWREISISGSCPVKHPRLESQLLAFISSHSNMVRTKADNVPGTYRKGEAVEHSSGLQGVLRVAWPKAREAEFPPRLYAPNWSSQAGSSGSAP